MMDYETARNMPMINASDPQALEKTKERLEAYKVEHERRKGINAFYRQVRTLRGCPLTTPEEAEELMANLETSLRGYKIPYGKKPMDSLLGSIRSFEKRIVELERRKTEPPPEGWRFDGGEVIMNAEANMVQIIFDERPDVDMIINLKLFGFALRPHENPHGAWQRQLTERAIEAAETLFPSKEK